MKKQFTVCGNCQALPLGQLLSNNKEFSEQYEFVPFPKPIFMLKEQDLDEVKVFLSKMDLFVFQQVGNAFGEHFSSEAMLSYTKSACKRLSFPSIYFTGYTPDLVYLRKSGASVNHYSDYHDAALVNFYLEDAQTAHAKYQAALNDPNYLSEQQILTNATNSLNELKKREEGVDVTISDFIEEKWLEDLLFFSFNHPSRRVLVEVARRLLSRMNINNLDIPGNYEFLRESIVPIHRSIRNLIKNPITEEIKIQGKSQSVVEFARAHLNIYENIERNQLIDNLKSLSKYRSISKKPDSSYLNPKEIIIHLGMSKTGTTTIQKYLSKHYDSLLSAGCLYPKSGRKSGECHHAIAKYYKENKFEEELNALLAEIESSKCSKVVISSELFERMGDEQWRQLKSTFFPHTVKAVIYLRAQHEAIVSMYNELVKKHVCSENFVEYLNSSPRMALLDYKELIEQIESHVGSENLTVLSFNADNNDVLDNFCHAIGLANHSESNSTKANTSMLPITTEVMRRINELGLIKIDHSKHYAEACELALLVNKVAIEQGFTDNYRVYFDSQESLANFYSAFQESNDGLKTKYNIVVDKTRPNDIDSQPRVDEMAVNKILNEVLCRALTRFPSNDSEALLKLLAVSWQSGMQSRLNKS